MQCPDCESGKLSSEMGVGRLRRGGIQSQGTAFFHSTSISSSRIQPLDMLSKEGCFVYPEEGGLWNHIALGLPFTSYVPSASYLASLKR